MFSRLKGLLAERQKLHANCPPMVASGDRDRHELPGARGPLRASLILTLEATGNNVWAALRPECAVRRVAIAPFYQPHIRANAALWMLHTRMVPAPSL